MGLNSKSIFMAFIAVLFIGCFYSVNAEESKDPSCFSKSLHAGGEGMRYWYEEEGGFKNLTGIPYNELDCKNCHVKSCDQCHIGGKEGKCTYSTEVAQKNETCLKCHSRAKVTIKINTAQDTLDVHFKNGMTCVDCHESHDVHGDGTQYNSMREKGAVTAACENCHEEDPEDTNEAHKQHKKDIHCSACHVKASTTCMNCHFEKFLETKQRKGNFIPPSQTWTLLMNYDGKVASANVQSLVYKGKKFIAYAPYFTHAIQEKGKDCSDCHANKATQLIQKGESVPMLSFKDGEVVHWEGIVPVAPDNLEWTFFDKKDEAWVPIENAEKPVVQFAGYGTPFSKEQIELMSLSPEDAKKAKEKTGKKDKKGNWFLNFFK